MPFTPEELAKIRDTELLKKEIRDELQPSESKSRVSAFFAHSAVLLILGFILTTGAGSWLTYFWKQRDWRNQQSYLARQRALDKKYAVIDRTFKEVSVTVAASQDVFATYFWNAWTEKEIQERRTNWLKTSRDWRIASNVLTQSIAINFSNPEIQTVFTTQVSGHDFSALPEMSGASRGLRSRAVQAAARTIPCAAGSRAAAPSKPGFGLLGRNAAEREQRTPFAFIGGCIFTSLDKPAKRCKDTLTSGKDLFREAIGTQLSAGILVRIM